MKKSIILLILIICSVLLYADQADDLRFAVGLYKDKNFDLAEVELKKFLTNYSDSSVENDVKFLLANIYLTKQEYKNAELYFSDLFNTTVNPQIVAEVSLGLAQCKYFTQDYVEARGILQNFIEEYSQNKLLWKAYYYLGKIDLLEKKFESASINLDKARSLNDQINVLSAILELNIAQNIEEDIDQIASEISQKADSENKFRALLLYHNYNLANNRYDKILTVGFEKIPSSSQYYSNYNLILGITYYQLNQYQNALKKLKKSDSEKSKYYSALCYYELQKEEKARSILNQLILSDNPQISSNSKFYLAKIDKDMSMLINFIKENPKHEFTPVAYYQLGLNSFVNKDYQEALSSFTKAKSSGNLVGKQAYFSIKEKIFYLLAESNFLLNKINDAQDAYELYLSVFKNGNFVDEANFKLGLINFNKNEQDISENYFNIVVKNFPESDKWGMSNYYLGEIYFFKGKYVKALKYYQDALDGNCDIGYTWERISHIYFNLKEYERAKESLEMIPSDTKYLFDMFMLKGDIEFAQRNYSKALDAFNFATEYAEGNKQNETALSRKAWTLYQLKQFDEAALIYSRLSGTTTTPEKYIIKAATSAFSAENYISAIDYFKQYTSNFSTEPDYYSAVLGTADSYYNLGDFNNAVQNYMILIQPAMDEQILNNAINGLRWSSEQSETIDFSEKVDEILVNCTDKKLRAELIDRKIYYLFKNGQWQEAIDSSKELEILNGDNKNASEIKLIRALCYEELEDFENAINTYEELTAQKQDPAVLRHWARLLIKMNQHAEAIQKLRKASMLTRREDIWLDLLKLELEQRDVHFNNDLNKFREFATGEEREIADLFGIEWDLINENYEGLGSLLEDRSKSKYKSVKARAQLLKGLLLGKQGDLDTAIPELLRIRYLYPEFDEIRNRAEVLVCKYYIQLGNIDEASKLYEVIKKDLSEDVKAELEKLLKGEEK